jgi:hypothetical protein
MTAAGLQSRGQAGTSAAGRGGLTLPGAAEDNARPFVER